VTTPDTLSQPLPRRAYLGMELGRRRGALYVTEVDPDSPAARAGVQLEDGLTAVAGETVADLVQVRHVVARLPVGRASALTLLRGETAVPVEVVPEATPLELLPSGRVELGQVVWQGHRLRTLWTWPDTRGPHQVVWLLPGASWLSEEHPTTPWYPTRKLVELLTAAGFATLRLERSGIGDSEGPPCRELDLHQELAMFRLGFAHVEREPRAQRERLFLFGRSLGGMLTALLGAGARLAGAAVWGTSSARWHDGLLGSTMRQYRLSGLSDAQLTRLRERLTQLQSLVYLEGLTPEQAYQRRPDLRELLPTVYSGRHVYGRVATYFQQLQAHDLRAAFAGIDAPVLALHGSCDWMSELSDLQTIAELAQRGEWAEIEGLDHLMHRRESLEAAFAQPFGGSFSDAAGQALVAFFGRC
jgi:alpha-beta hydrolase superfamily lysophospholipase